MENEAKVMADEIKSTLDNLKTKQESIISETEKTITERFEAIKKEFDGKEAFSKDSPEFKAMEKTIADLNKSIEDMGKKKGQEVVGVTKKVGAIFQEKHAEFEKNPTQKGERGENFSIETKAFDSLNVMSVASVASGTYPANGTVSAVGAEYRSRYAQVLGIFDVPRVYSRIMDVVDISPLVTDTIMAFTQTITNGFAITPELVEKPASKIAFTSESATADPVTSLFYTTLHMRRFYTSLTDDFTKTFRKLLQEAIPNHVMSVVRANATAFTPVGSLTFAEPGEFEVIVSNATALKKLGYMPNMLALSPVSYARLVLATDSTGAYKLQNGSSIVLVGDTVKIGSHNLTIIEDPFLEDDEYMIGDAGAAIKVGLDTEIFYAETDGRTDNQNAAGTAPSTGLAVNVTTHELAQFVAVLLPAGAKGALNRDTFSNAKTLITTAP